MSEKVILTEEGYQELEKRLEYLKFTKRPEITERIKVARDFGDLSENAEYDAAKNEQARIEGEIIEIEAQLKAAEIIKTSDIKKGVVSVGSKVRVYDEDEKEETVYEIVGTTEADIKVKGGSEEVESQWYLIDEEGKITTDGLVLTVFDYTQYQPDMQYETLSFLAHTLRKFGNYGE